MRKAQMEILGLAIVVVLVLVGLVFAVRFIILKDDTSFRDPFLSSEIASNTINTFLKTNSRDCNDLTMTELLQNCAQRTGIVCNNGESTCKYVNSTAFLILGQTLEEWNYEYEFLAYENANPPIIELGNACPGQKRSKLFPIPIKSGTMFVKLDICG
jgi:hypothetical protein